MDKMKKFFVYFLVFIAFFVFSNLMIKAFLKVSYSDMHGYEINVNSDQLFVDVSEAKSSKRNGYINGIVKNNGDSVVENRYLKVTMLSKRKISMGEKYIKIDKTEPKELRKFEIKFDYDNVKTFKIELVDSKPEGKEENFVELVKNNAKDLIKKDFNK